MKGKRTGLEFENHVVEIQRNDLVTIHTLGKPESSFYRIKFINAGGVLSVTGDLGNWIFSVPFMPSLQSTGVCDSYWSEKLRLSSCQVISSYDAEETEKELKRLLQEEEDLSEEEIEYLEEGIGLVYDELDYTHHAYRNSVGRWSDLEDVPFCKKGHGQLPYVFDAFDEIVRRYKSGEIK